MNELSIHSATGVNIQVRDIPATTGDLQVIEITVKGADGNISVVAYSNKDEKIRFTFGED